MKTENTKLVWQDYLFILGILFNIGALVSTYLLVGLVNHTTGTSVGNALEANPWNEFLLHVPILQILEYCGLWGLTVFWYLNARKTAFSKSKYMIPFTFWIMVLFLLLMFDFVNDFSLVAKVLIA